MALRNYFEQKQEIGIAVINPGMESVYFDFKNANGSLKSNVSIDKLKTKATKLNELSQKNIYISFRNNGDQAYPTLSVGIYGNQQKVTFNKPIKSKQWMRFVNCTKHRSFDQAWEQAINIYKERHSPSKEKILQLKNAKPFKTTLESKRKAFNKKQKLKGLRVMSKKQFDGYFE